MPLHGLKVEKKIGASYDEAQGMIDFYAEMNNLYDGYIDDSANDSDEQGLVDAVFLKFARPHNVAEGASPYRVTYSEDNAGGNLKEVIRKANGRLKPPIKALRDKVSEKRLHMVVPSQKPVSSEGYVTNIISKIGTLPAGQKEMYLLGTILIRKCR